MIRPAVRREGKEAGRAVVPGLDDAARKNRKASGAEGKKKARRMEGKRPALGYRFGMKLSLGRCDGKSARKAAARPAQVTCAGQAAHFSLAVERPMREAWRAAVALGKTPAV